MRSVRRQRGVIDRLPLFLRVLLMHMNLNDISFNLLSITFTTIFLFFIY